MSKQIRSVYEEIWNRKLSARFESTRGKIIAPLLPRGGRLLDVGCGNGELGRLYLRDFDEIWGVDISERALSEARTTGMKVQQVDLNTVGLPYRAVYFDVVTCLDVLEHVFDPRFVLQEIYRVLKDDGCLIASTVNIAFVKFRLSLLSGRFPVTARDPEAIDGGHLHYLTYDGWVRLLRQCAFEPTALIVLGKLASVRKWWPNLLAGGFFVKCRKIPSAG